MHIILLFFVMFKCFYPAFSFQLRRSINEVIVLCPRQLALYYKCRSNHHLRPSVPIKRGIASQFATQIWTLCRATCFVQRSVSTTAMHSQLNQVQLYTILRCICVHAVSQHSSSFHGCQQVVLMHRDSRRHSARAYSTE